MGARVRPTIYCPIDQLDPDMSVETVSLYNRQLVVECEQGLPGVDRLRAYGLIFGREPRPTEVFSRIPERRGATPPLPG